MAYDFRTRRLFTEQPLAGGQAIEADRPQAHYLVNVLRMKAGDAVLLFNGRDGEWLAHIAETGKKKCTLLPAEQTRRQTPAYDLEYLFAPLKQARLDYMVQKAVEMGAGRLQPVITQYTQSSRVNLERMRANAVEAAEQCGILTIPDIDTPQKLDAVLDAWPDDRALVFCDESAESGDATGILKSIGAEKITVLIGPEGGFSEAERAHLCALSFVTPISLGPRILRADTAAVAALALVQSAIGDWGGTGTDKG
jgi:16S rRNA (uracil1498-N3)-methyltransferase